MQQEILEQEEKRKSLIEVKIDIATIDKKQNDDDDDDD